MCASAASKTQDAYAFANGDVAEDLKMRDTVIRTRIMQARVDAPFVTMERR